DGIETDDYGNLYLCSRDGIVVVDKHGERLALIRFETIPANLCWGGETGSDLLVTARQNVFFIKDFRKRLN
ncbi:MAG TPA: hypothetical protein VEZ55_05995, partial [Chitinophagaceae bacterium]|nr:hypothetical protein [Chitinophagaceae bacterium]